MQGFKHIQSSLWSLLTAGVLTAAWWLFLHQMTVEVIFPVSVLTQPRWSELPQTGTLVQTWQVHHPHCVEVAIPLSRRVPKSGLSGGLLLPDGTRQELLGEGSIEPARELDWVPEQAYLLTLRVPPQEANSGQGGAFQLTLRRSEPYLAVSADGKQAGTLTHYVGGGSDDPSMAEELSALRIPVVTRHKLTPYQYMRGSLQGMLSRQSWPFNQVWFYAVLLLGYGWLLQRWLRKVRRFWRKRQLEALEETSLVG